MKRRWITLGFLVGAVALGAWLIFSAKPEGQVSIRFLGFETNAWGGRVAQFSITNGHDFPVLCWVPPPISRGELFPPTRQNEKIGPHSIFSRYCDPNQIVLCPDQTWRMRVSVAFAVPATRSERMRTAMSQWLRQRNYRRLSSLIAPRNTELAQSEPITLVPEAKKEQ